MGMALTAKVHVRASVIETSGFEPQRVDSSSTVSDVVGNTGKRETVALTAAFTALSPPTGAAVVVIRVISGAVTLTLKGPTGDTGIVLQSAALTTPPIVLPLGTSYATTSGCQGRSWLAPTTRTGGVMLFDRDAFWDINHKIMPAIKAMYFFSVCLTFFCFHSRFANASFSSFSKV